MNLNKLLVFIFLMTSYSCSNLTPLYIQDEDAQQKITNLKIMPIEGRYGVYLKNELEETFGAHRRDNKNSYFILETNLNVSSGGVESFRSDGTASRFGAFVTIDYALYDPEGCAIFSKSVSTNASYNSKSEGYNFGNKASERAAIKRNIEYNVKQVYSQIYYEIKYAKKTIPSKAPFLAISGDYRWC